MVMSVLLLTFCRFVLLWVFVLALVGKMKDLRQLTEAVKGFRLLPERLGKPVALSVVGAELLVIGLLLFSATTTAGLALAIALLGLFSLALASALKRDIVTSCYCFGTGEEPVSSWDVWRNLGLIAIAVVGLVLTTRLEATALQLGTAETIVVALCALVLVVLARHASDIAQLLKASRPTGRRS